MKDLAGRTIPAVPGRAARHAVVAAHTRARCFAGRVVLPCYLMF
jgi:hypothetical protein